MSVPKKVCEFCGVVVSVNGRHLSRGRCDSVERGNSSRRNTHGR